MGSDAYLSTYNFELLNPRLFPISLIAYDRLFVNLDFHKIPWETAKMYRGKNIDNKTRSIAEEYKKKKDDNKGVTWAGPEMGLGYYIDWDYRNLENLKKSLLCLKQSGPSQTIEFLTNPFPQPYYNEEPIYIRFLFDWIDGYFKKYWGRSYKWFYDEPVAATLAKDFFTLIHLFRKTTIIPILSLDEIFLWKDIQKSPIILTAYENHKFKMLQSKFVKYITSELSFLEKKLLDINENSNHQIVETIMDFTVPKIEDIPLKEIISLKKTNKLSTISQLANEIRDKRKSSNLDIAKIFIDKLWKLAKTIQPSVGENTIGILGEIPLPFPNPLGLISAGSSLNKLVQFEKDYSWFILLSKLDKNQA